GRIQSNACLPSVDGAPSWHSEPGDRTLGNSHVSSLAGEMDVRATGRYRSSDEYLAERFRSHSSRPARVSHRWEAVDLEAEVRSAVWPRAAASGFSSVG